MCRCTFGPRERQLGRDLGAGVGLVDLTHLEGAESLKEASAIVGAGLAIILHHLLRGLASRLGAALREHLLNLGHVGDLAVLAVDAHDHCVLAVPLLGALEDLEAGAVTGVDAGRGHGELRNVIENVGGLEVLDALDLDHLDLEMLLVVLGELGGEHLDHAVGLVLLGVDVRIEIGLASLDGLLDRVDGVPTLLVVTLHLPVELDLGGDVNIDAEVHERVYTVVVEGVQTLYQNEFTRETSLLYTRARPDPLCWWRDYRRTP